MTKLTKYSKHKNSNIEHLNEVPTQWEIVKFKYLFTFSKGLNITKENLQEIGIPCINYGEIHSKYGFEIIPEKHHLKCVSKDYLLNSKKSLLKYGDFIFADTSEDISGSGNFTYLNSNKEIFAGYHTVIATTIYQQNIRFLAYLIDSISYRTQIRKKVKGVKVYSITNSILKDTLLWIPQKKEQQKIANYLDQKTKKIDNSIIQKKELVKLLKERQQILINDAITKGIDNSVQFKESNIQWLGKVPKHWEIRKGKYLFVEVDERSKDGKEELLSVSHMTGVTPRSEKNVTMFMSEDYTGSKTCQKDDLVINIMWAWMGALGISDREGIVSSSYGIYRQRETNTFNSSYLEYLLGTNDYIAEYNRRSTGLHVSRLRLYSDMFLDMKIATPPIEEQNAIINFIKENNSKINKAINIQEQQIKLLEELKETLIDSCVTGKVKVP